jgi:putative acyl-CoA dehydrogenase
MSTHTVLNQSQALVDFNPFTSDQGLVNAFEWNARQNLSADMSARIENFGAAIGAAQYQQFARLANENGPVLKSHDNQGRRIDQVQFHPAYHALMTQCMQAGLHASPWSSKIKSAHLERAVKFLMHSGIESGVLCPISMTYAVVPALCEQASILVHVLPKLVGTQYDERFINWQSKTAMTMGMGMTEKQGGSDVRANTTQALADGSGGYLITGHKWFFSAPMCDAFLILAQIENSGLSCFFLPRIKPDGSVNPIRIERLKDKLGNRANASSEVEFDQAQAWLVGEPGRGIATILEMGTVTRIDCALCTAGLMRHATAIALDHCRQRKVFGKYLQDQPLMQATLADLALESEAATALALRVARTLDYDNDPHEQIIRRLITPVAKFWICKRGAQLAQEAMECLGGNGYVEDGVMARIYREMPLNSIWEGAGNIMGLDVLRSLKKGPVMVQALQQEIKPSLGKSSPFDQFAQSLLSMLNQECADEMSGRYVASQLALLIQANCLLQHSPAFVSQAFCDTRLVANTAAVFGANIQLRHNPMAIIERAMPKLAKPSADLEKNRTVNS